MFRVNRAEEQAVRLTMRMALLDRQVTLGELAAAEELPEPTVAKLLGMLRRDGVVTAVRGRNGGYVLADRPETIAVARVLRAVGAETVFAYPCRDDDRPDCTRTTDCGLRPVWRHLERRVVEVLQRTTLADLLRPEKAARDDLQELWPLPRA